MILLLDQPLLHLPVPLLDHPPVLLLDQPLLHLRVPLLDHPPVPVLL